VDKLGVRHRSPKVDIADVKHLKKFIVKRNIPNLEVLFLKKVLEYFIGWI